MNELEKKLQEEYKENKRKWMLENGFDEAGITYVLTGDTYAIKEELKAKGYKYNQILRWHKSTIDEEYTGRAFRLTFDEVAEMSAWGKGIYKPEAQKYVDDKILQASPASTSVWIPAEEIKGLEVTLINKHSFEGQYGLTYSLTFVDEKDRKLVWFTSTIQNIDAGSHLKITSAKFKKHDVYKNEQLTVISRVKFVEI